LLRPTDSQFEEHLQGERLQACIPGVRVDTSATAAVGQAGGLLLTRTVRATGLDRFLSAALAVHDPGKIITDLALSLALGGDCLADLAVLRAEPGVFGLVASDPTVSRAIATRAGDALAVLKAIDTARAADSPHPRWTVLHLSERAPWAHVAIDAITGLDHLTAPPG